MNDLASPPQAPPPPRPGYHFTVPQGWINDPHGISWHETADGGRYELFFQYNPEAPEWTVACRWGRSSAPDLVRWGPTDVVLAPRAGEAGCWTGSVVVEDDGTPVIVYTSVRAADLDLGAVVLAVGDREWRTWRADPAAPVLAGPPEGLGMRVFRDPHVERDGAGWRMVVGGGTTDGRGLALLYRSADLRAWSYEGVLAERSSAETEPLWAGSAWECVQFFPLEGRWVLLLSAWDDGATLRVVAAVGDFDGRRFTAAAWQRLGATDVLYATTTFLDAAGRRCAMSWAREAGPSPTARSGALSLPWVLGVRGDRLVQTPHPDVDTLRTGTLARIDGAGEAGPFPPFLDIELRLDVRDPRARLELRAGAPGGAAPVIVELGPRGAVRVSGEGREPVLLEAAADPGGGAAVRLLVDATLLEVATADGNAAVLRLPGSGPLTVAVAGGSPVVVVHGMPSGSA